MEILFKFRILEMFGHYVIQFGNLLAVITLSRLSLLEV
jgi:hypothetical protein